MSTRADSFASADRRREWEARFGRMNRNQRERFARIAAEYRELKSELTEREPEASMGSSLNPALIALRGGFAVFSEKEASRA